LPPPWGATGFEPSVKLENKSIHLVDDARHTENEQSLLQARLRGIYDQDDTTFIVKYLINLAIKWNRLDSSTEVKKGRVQNVKEDTVHAVSKKVSGESEGSRGQGISDTFQIRLQEIYGQDSSASMERDFMELAKEWNDSGSKYQGIDLRLQNKAVYTVGVQEGVETGALSENGGAASFQARLQGLYGQPEEPDKERNFMILAKAWNASCRVQCMRS